MTSIPSTPPLRTVLLYTEEKRGNQLVESPIIGMLSDFSGSEKLVVIQDPHTRINFVYRIDSFNNNLDAVSVSTFTEEDFRAKKNTTINGATFKLGTSEEAQKLLRGRNEWIQDKGSILSVLLRAAATKNVGFVRPQIQRERVTQVPPGTPIERLDMRNDDPPVGADAPPPGGDASGPEGNPTPGAPRPPSRGDAGGPAEPDPRHPQ